jgi:hypothetical protein
MAWCRCVCSRIDVGGSSILLRSGAKRNLANAQMKRTVDKLSADHHSKSRMACRAGAFSCRRVSWYMLGCRCSNRVEVADAMELSPGPGQMNCA